MCIDVTILKRSKNGKISKCYSCETYHLNFGQFYLSLNLLELKRFISFINNIDPDYWSNICNKFHLDRRIPIPTEQNNLCLMLNKEEFEELKYLINHKTNQQKSFILSISDIEYTLINN